MAVDHAIRFQGKGPAQVRIRGPERLEVVGAIEGGLAIGAGAPLRQLLGNVGMAGRPLEEQVLQEVRHASLAVVLVPTAHQIGDVDGDGRFAGIREQQDPQAIGEAVLGDAFDAGEFRQRSRRRPGAKGGQDQHPRRCNPYEPSKHP